MAARYPRRVRNARVKCIECNAPAVQTVDGDYVCVDCASPVVSDSSDAPDLTSTAASETDDQKASSAGRTPAE